MRPTKLTRYGFWKDVHIVEMKREARTVHLKLYNNEEDLLQDLQWVDRHAYVRTAFLTRSTWSDCVYSGLNVIPVSGYFLNSSNPFIIIDCRGSPFEHRLISQCINMSEALYLDFRTFLVDIVQEKGNGAIADLLQIVRLFPGRLPGIH